MVNKNIFVLTNSYSDTDMGDGFCNDHTEIIAAYENKIEAEQELTNRKYNNYGYLSIEKIKYYFKD